MAITRPVGRAEHADSCLDDCAEAAVLTVGAGHLNAFGVCAEHAATQGRVVDPDGWECGAVILGVDLEVLSWWRRQGTYPDDADVLWAAADRLAPAYAVLASELAGVLARHPQAGIAAGAALAGALAVSAGGGTGRRAERV